MGYDVGSTYNNIGETTLTKDTAAKLDVAWTADLGGNVYGAALQIGDKMYATGPSTVRAFDAASGMELWKVSAQSTGALAYSDGTLYLNSTSGNMMAFSAADGKMLWMKSSGPMADGTSSAIVAGDFVLMGGSNGVVELTAGMFRGFVQALNKKTGEMAWLTYNVPEGSAGASLWSTVSVDLEGKTVFAGTGNNYTGANTDTSDAIIAYDLMTGMIKWKNQRQKGDVFPGGSGPDADFGANPVLYETMVAGALTKLVAGAQKGGNVHGLTRDGKEVWTRMLCTGAADGSSGIFTNLAWAGKNLIVACNEGGPATLYGLDGATGNIAWMRKLSAQVWGRTAVANGVGFVGTGKALEAFDVDTGALIKSFNAKAGTIASTITVSRGRVAFGEGLSWSSGVRGSTLTVLAIK